LHGLIIPNKAATINVKAAALHDRRAAKPARFLVAGNSRAIGKPDPFVFICCYLALLVNRKHLFVAACEPHGDRRRQHQVHVNKAHARG
jgi:hypothetical protein